MKILIQNATILTMNEKNELLVCRRAKEPAKALKFAGYFIQALRLRK